MFDTLLIIILLLLGITSVSLIIINDLLTLIFVTSIISVLIAIIYILLDAIDVALTEIVVGAGVSTILMLITTHLTNAYNINGANPIQRFSRVSPSNLLTTILLIIIFLLSLDSLAYVPIFGDINSPANSNIIYKVYTQSSYETFGIKNAVTMILGAFRGYDTLGETTVILIGAIGVHLVLQKDKPDLKTPISNIKPVIYKKEYIIHSAIFSMLPFILLFAFYVQLHGDSGPGGGFQAGVVMGAFYFLIVMFFGKHIANNFISTRYLIILLAFGVLIYAGTGLLTMLLGGFFLDYLVFGNNPLHSYHYGLFAIELGVGITVFTATSIIIKNFYSKLEK